MENLALSKRQCIDHGEGYLETRLSKRFRSGETPPISLPETDQQHLSGTDLRNTTAIGHDVTHDDVSSKGMLNQACIKADATQEPIVTRSYQPNDEVCFGMIIFTNVQLAESSAMKLSTRPVPASWKENRIVLCDTITKTNTNHAIPSYRVVNEKYENILQNLEQNKKIKIQLMCQASASSASKGGTTKMCDLLVNIYGKYLLFEQIGQFLQECGFYLQDPVNCDRDLVYLNPHCLSVFDQDPVYTRDFCSHPEEFEDVGNPADVFSQLSTTEFLEEAPQPLVLQTVLRGHQREGLTFLLRREKGWSFQSRIPDIWRLGTGSPPIYVNTITNQQQSIEPPAFRGGIVADQMGLGKTLLMIALIATDIGSDAEDLPYKEEEYQTSNEHIAQQEPVNSTLIVVPSSLLETWARHLEQNLRQNTLRWTTFHGPKRPSSIDQLLGYNIILTTYGTISSEYKTIQAGKLWQSCFSVRWRRLILDEAHIIRRSSSLQTKAICSLDAARRWAVSGTPIQNRLTDLVSLISFLRVHPFDDPATFDREILSPWKRFNDPDAVWKLKLLVKHITLRRTKDVLHLPSRTNLIHKIDMTPFERQAYESVRLQTNSFLQIPRTSLTSKTATFNILHCINQLRMTCNSVFLLGSQSDHLNRTWNAKPQHQELEALEIMAKSDLLCDNDENSERELDLSSLHAEDSANSSYLDGSRLSTASISSLNSSSGELDGELPPPLSTKLSAVLRDVLDSPIDSKVVVFSSWIKTLNLLALSFTSHFINFVRYDGTRSLNERNQAVRLFNTDPAIRVLLATTTSAGVGLDLTAASLALLIEPQWNPMVEEQALSRIHRMGQTKEVKTIRYQVRNSVEESIIELQNNKTALAGLAMSGKNTEESKSTLAMLARLLK